MSESDNFLSRWSRRKQEAARDVAPPATEKTEDKRAATEAAAERQTPATPDLKPDEPVFDLSKLPSLDSIGPDSDVRLFLQPGVPAVLSRAALRRAWSADPAIRDFIGLSENSWDFTAPNSVTGFGPLLPTDDVKRMLARVFNEPSTDDRPTEAEVSTASQQADGVAEEPVLEQQASADQTQSTTLQSSAPDEGKTALQCSIDDAAKQQKETPEVAGSSGNRRRHGGALPT